MSSTIITHCMPYPVTFNMEQQELIHCDHSISLPPTPIASDDEEEHHSQKTVSLADLIPIASAALLKNKQTIQQEDSSLARALTRVKIGLQTHRLKESYLTKEWIRLALAMPVNASMINTEKKGQISRKRTKEISTWFEHKLKKRILTLDELEKKVDELRRQRQEESLMKAI
ncbi:uncharacterized protein BX663DRAFT_263142 [Cokeromyces recurvatus]|uniref:uncharacterized protein n=1 Tax=Cokeromyces recurvatus TaxID=90255 RepID=UPI00221F5D69|nr:uncharacterized protein BX663DRAFT_263142 [Cokeromyces recurvatus]KAI7898280.1 hypothetical protein BX663DRAFT_263142 [Cokeromyces recurvatus]